MILSMHAAAYRQTKSGRWEVRWWERDHIDRRFRRFRGGFDRRADAAAWYNNRLDLVRRGKLPDPDATPPVPATRTLGELIQLYIRDIASNTRQKSQQRTMLVIKILQRHIPPSTAITAIDARMADQFIAARRQVVAVGTVNRELATLNHLLNTARRWNLIESNPLTDIRRLKPVDHAIRYLTTKEQHDLIAACRRSRSPWLLPIVILALNTGLRRGELLNLRWKHVDFGNRILSVENTELFQTKSGRNRAVGLNAAAISALQEWRDWFGIEIKRLSRRRHFPHRQPHVARRLDALRARIPTPDRLVFPAMFAADNATGEALPHRSLDKQWEVIRRQANITHRFHDLRHTFAVQLARAGVPLVQIAHLLGHSNLATTHIYLRFAPNEAIRATDLLPTRHLITCHSSRDAASPVASPVPEPPLAGDDA